ncbi:MAG TPA: hypothetical protein VD999_07415 [Vitreimonas sp.]|nr:hypothetical protein [Vitreimonas sp.]
MMLLIMMNEIDYGSAFKAEQKTRIAKLSYENFLYSYSCIDEELGELFSRIHNADNYQEELKQLMDDCDMKQDNECNTSQLITLLKENWNTLQIVSHLNNREKTLSYITRIKILEYWLSANKINELIKKGEIKKMLTPVEEVDALILTEIGKIDLIVEELEDSAGYDMDAEVFQQVVDHDAFERLKKLRNRLRRLREVRLKLTKKFLLASST